jgi:fructose-specific component phosphotransferase system IIB-like protein
MAAGNRTWKRPPEQQSGTQAGRVTQITVPCRRNITCCYAGHVNDATARSVALIAAAISRIGTGILPAELMSEATQYVSWIRPRSAAQMLFSVEGDSMPLNVDSVGKLAVLSFTDDKNEAVAPPAGTLATASSDTPGVMTVGAAVAGADANGVANIQFPLTEVAAGTANLSVTTTDANGNPLLGPDGVTPIADPAPVLVTVTPGAPADEIFSVDQS